MYERLKKDEDSKDTSIGIPLYNINDQKNQQQQDRIKITVKNAEDPVEYIELRANDRVQLLKSTILKIKDKSSYNIRVIYNGKMLRDDSMTLKDCKLDNGSVVICSITEPIVFSTPTIAQIPPSVDNNSSNNSSTHSNRLQNSNNSSNNIPIEFVIDMERTRQQLNIGSNGGLDLPSVQTQTQQSRFLGGSSPLVRESLELCFGLCFGFFFGPISLFWITKEYLPRTTKMGIIFGVIFSVSLSLVRLSARTSTI